MNAKNEAFAMWCLNDAAKVYINRNNDTGEWQYSVQIEDSEFWLDSFPTEAEAQRLVDAWNHYLVGEYSEAASD